MASEILKRDQNHVTVLGGVTDDSNQDIVMLRVDPITKRLLISTTGGIGTGTVTSVSVVSANGFSGTVANPTTTPAITIIYTPRVVTTTDDATSVIDVEITDIYELTAITNNTTFSFTGTPIDGQKFIIRYKDAGVSKNLTWTGFVAIGATLPSATTAGKWTYVGVQYNLSASAYHVLAVTTQA